MKHADILIWCARKYNLHKDDAVYGQHQRQPAAVKINIKFLTAFHYWVMIYQNLTFLYVYIFFYIEVSGD